MNNHEKKKVELCLTFVCERRNEQVVMVESVTGLVLGEYTLFSGLELGHEGNVFWRVLSPIAKAELLRQAAVLGLDVEAEAEGAKS